VGKSTGDRARLFDSERFKRKFVTTLADLRGELGFRIVGYVLIPQGGSSTTASQGERALRQAARFIIDATTPFPLLRRGGEPGCSAGPAVRPLRSAQGRLCGSSSDAGSCRAGVALTPQGAVSRSGIREKCRPRRAGSALHWLGRAVKNCGQGTG
jgi:hypothetical protein